MDYLTGEVKGACVTVERCILGLLENNVYIISELGNRDNCFVVDPSQNCDYLLEMLDGRTPQAIICTHFHYDHVGAAAALRAATGAPVYAHAIDAPHISAADDPFLPPSRKVAPCEVDVELFGAEDLVLAGVSCRVLHTPGHSAGSISLFAAVEGARPVLISGDTLFAGTYGRTDGKDGSPAQMAHSLAKLRTLPDNTVVLPGHGEFTTIAQAEREVFSRYLG